jgi:outer membrane protein assembly factor BamD (BamD/ComL family)
VFSKSPRAAYAMLQAAKSSYASFRGVDWDDTPLLDARQRYEAYRERFPLQAEQANVPRTLETIRLTLAQKMYGIGVFYERVHRPDAAKFYYKKVIETYPGTPSQSAASAALMRLGLSAPLAPATQPASAPATAPAAEERP